MHTSRGSAELAELYLTVNTDVVGVGAFLAVDGGDTAVATGTGAQTLVARGTTDSSGNLTISWGVQDIGAVPASAGADALDYADQATAEAAGWTVTDTAPGGAVTFNTGHAIAGSGVATSVKLDAGGSGGLVRLERDFTVVSGQTYQARVWGESASAPWFQALSLTAISGANSVGDDINGGEAAQELSASVVADGTTLTVRLNVNSATNGHGFYASGLTIDGIAGGGAEVDFLPVAGAVGTGTGDGGQVLA